MNYTSKETSKRVRVFPKTLSNLQALMYWQFLILNSKKIINLLIINFHIRNSYEKLSLGNLLQKKYIINQFKFCSTQQQRRACGNYHVNFFKNIFNRSMNDSSIVLRTVHRKRLSTASLSISEHRSCIDFFFLNQIK